VSHILQYKKNWNFLQNLFQQNCLIFKLMLRLLVIIKILYIMGTMKTVIANILIFLGLIGAALVE